MVATVEPKRQPAADPTFAGLAHLVAPAAELADLGRLTGAIDAAIAGAAEAGSANLRNLWPFWIASGSGWAALGALRLWLQRTAAGSNTTRFARVSWLIVAVAGGARVMVRRGEYLPLLSVRDALGVDGPPGGELMVVIVDTDADARIGLLVDELIGQRQVVLKSLEANYRSVPGISGATILGDGRAALILDVPALHQLASPGAPFTRPEAAKMEYAQ